MPPAKRVVMTIFYNFFYDFVFYDFGCYINIIWAYNINYESIYI